MNEVGHHIYSDKFFDYIDSGSRRSAKHIIPIVCVQLQPSSVLDVGCGRGVWVKEWSSNGVADAVGADGNYIHIESLIIPKNQFVTTDLSRKFRLNRRFDLVQSLEVAEHIAEPHAEVFIDNLAAHSDVVLFSAATPGQGGEFHVNEQSYEYWRTKFASREFEVFDFLRPQIAKIREIEPWYRYNTLLFVHGSATDRLPDAVRRTCLPQDVPIPDVAPLPWHLRNLMFRNLPQPVVQRIARIKHAAFRAMPVRN